MKEETFGNEHKGIGPVTSRYEAWFSLCHPRVPWLRPRANPAHMVLARASTIQSVHDATPGEANMLSIRVE